MTVRFGSVGKRKKRARKPPAAAGSNKPAKDPAATAEQARRALDEHRYRRARDLLKPLHKADPGRFHEPLVEAYRGLHAEAVKAGNATQATQFLEQLELLGETVCPGAKVEALVRAGRWPEAEAAAIDILRRHAGDPAAPAGRPEHAAADALVATPDPNCAERLPEGSARDLAAVRAAFQALGESRLDAVADRLRSVGHRSPFAHWKLYLRGLHALFTGAGAKAAACFSKLPPDSLAAEAGAPYALAAAGSFAPGRDRRAAEEAVRSVADLCSAFGWEELAPVAPRLEELWRKGRHWKAMEEGRRRLRGFPSPHPGPLGALSDFFFCDRSSLPDEAKEDYLDNVRDLAQTDLLRSPEEELRTIRASLVTTWAGFDDESLAAISHDLERAINRWPYGSKRLVAELQARVGNIFLCDFAVDPARPGPRFPGAPGDARNAGLAVTVFRSLARRYPDRVDFQLKLAEAYAADRNAPARRKLMDQLAKTFPENRAVLLAAGRDCLERKAYPKGIRYLEKAQEADPLNPEARDELCRGHALAADAYYRKGNLVKARASGAAAVAAASPGDGRAGASRWTVLAQLGLMETDHGDGAEAARLFAEASAGAALPAEFEFFRYAHWLRAEASRLGNGPKRFPWRKELQAATRSVASAPAVRILLNRVTAELKAPGDSRPGCHLLEPFNDAVAAYVASPAFEIDDANILARSALDEALEEATETLADSVLREDPSNPVALLIGFENNDDDDLDPCDIQFIEEELIPEAERRRDFDTVQRARRFIEKSRRGPGTGPPDEDEFLDFLHRMILGQEDDEEWPAAFGPAGFPLPPPFPTGPARPKGAAKPKPKGKPKPEPKEKEKKPKPEPRDERQLEFF